MPGFLLTFISCTIWYRSDWPSELGVRPCLFDRYLGSTWQVTSTIVNSLLQNRRRWVRILFANVCASGEDNWRGVCFKDQKETSQRQADKW